MLVFMQERMRVEMENARVLVADQKVEAIKDIIPILEQISRINQPLLIITEDVTGILQHGASLELVAVAFMDNVVLSLEQFGHMVSSC